MLPDILAWIPGYEWTISYCHPTSVLVWLYQSFHYSVACCYIESIFYFFLFLLDFRWYQEAQRWLTTHWKLSKHVGGRHVGLYSTSEVHKITKNHTLQSQQRGSKPVDFTVFLPKIKNLTDVGGKSHIHVGVWESRHTNCFSNQRRVSAPSGEIWTHWR